MRKAPPVATVAVGSVAAGSAAAPVADSGEEATVAALVEGKAPVAALVAGWEEGATAVATVPYSRYAPKSRG